MSLLLDALRRAEEAKRAKQGPAETAAPPGVGIKDAVSGQPDESLLAEPAKPSVIKAADKSGSSGLTLALEEDLSLAEKPALKFSEPAAAMPPNRPSIPAPKDAIAETPAEVVSSRKTAEAVFSAKQAKPAGSRALKTIGALTFLVVGLSISGFYAWTEIIPKVRPALLAMTPRPILPSPVTAPKAAENVTPVAEPQLPPLLPPPAIEPPLPKSAALPAIPANVPAKITLAEAVREIRPVEAGSPRLRLATRLGPATINPQLASAYDALVRGDYLAAAEGYARLISAEPTNVDAHLGLATAAARSGDSPTAVRHFRRVLELDPTNTLANTGLMTVNEQIEPAQQENQYRALLTNNPDSAPLHFALGNLLAKQRRWSEAQQAYFEAWRIDSDNPDYLYNLAVSLDQLGQARLAVSYYRKALAQHERHRGQFDAQTVADRLAKLGVN